MNISPISEIISDYKSGRFVIMVDSPDRENEGDIMFAADFTDAEKINFLSQHARGLICLTLQEERVKRLQLPMQISPHHRTHKNSAAFTCSIEAREGVTTGISARERAHTIRVAIAEATVAEDLVVPGHVFPLVAKNGGVVARAGHTEASVDLAKLAGLTPAGVICEVLDGRGESAKGEALESFARAHGIKIGTIDQLVGFVRRNASLA